MALAVPLGLAIALNRHVADTFRPVLSFLQAIAGIAWVPLTIIWFGIGNGSVIFVIASVGIMFVYNALTRFVIGTDDQRFEDGARFVLVEGLHRLEAAKALGEQTIVGFRVDARKH